MNYFLETMQSSKSAKLRLVAASFVLTLLFEGMAGLAVTDEFAITSETGAFVQSDADLDKCVDGEALDYSSCCNSQHCANCYAAVSRISIVIDQSGGVIAPYEPVRRLQIDHRPQFKPPRIS